MLPRRRIAAELVRSCRIALCAAAPLALLAAVPLSARADAKSAMPASAGTLKMVHSAHSPEVFTPATLENHIDGEAQAVKEYSFRQCVYTEYSPTGAGNQLLTVDIFEMGSPQDAYGYYSHQRSPDAPTVKIGAEGYQESTSLNFWKGPYYVRIAITATNPAPFRPQMPVIARAIAAKLTGSTAPPAILGLLPPGYKPHTEQFQRSNIAGQAFISNGVTARYPAVGPQAELFVAIYASPAAAKAAFGRYQAYLSQPTTLAMGTKSAPLKGVGDMAIGAKTRFAGQVVAAVKGKYLAGIRKANNAGAAQTLLKSALARAH